MKILGIDPGYAILGYGIVEKIGNRFKVCSYGAVTTDASMDATSGFSSSIISLRESYRYSSLSVISIEASVVTAP